MAVDIIARMLANEALNAKNPDGTPVVDKTLSKSGQAADAKAVGEALAELKASQISDPETVITIQSAL
jgi:hypothetical protein